MMEMHVVIEQNRCLYPNFKGERYHTPAPTEAIHIHDPASSPQSPGKPSYPGSTTGAAKKFLRLCEQQHNTSLKLRHRQL